MPKMFQKSFLRSLLQEEALIFWIVTAPLASIVIRLYAHEGAFRDAFASLFDAIFIAAFLAKVVDPVIKSKLVKDGIKDVFLYAYGYRLPQPLLDFFDSTILRARFLRANARLHWDVVLNEEQGATATNAIRIKLLCRFEPINFYDQDLEYVHDVYAINDSPSEEAIVSRLYCREHATGKYLYPEPGFEVPQAGIDVEREHGKRQPTASGKGSSIPLPANMALTSGLFECGVEFASYAPIDYGFDEFRVSELTPRTSVTVSVHRSLKDHLFSISPLPSDEIEEKAPTLDAASGQLRCCWEYERLMVPNETISLRWRSGGSDH